ncbi:SDR family oxidoreductase [Rothia kristinae]|uniref:SDR family oxidoreductase n=1 Tax=Rothia kristinae TaxID=37923 RepID=UPI0033CF14B3
MSHHPAESARKAAADHQDSQEHPDAQPVRVGITGATGLIGGGVSRLLQERGIPHRLLVRRPEAVRQRVEDSEGLLETARGDFADPAGLREAMTGLDTVFMVSITEAAHRDEQQIDAVAAASAAGVRHLVYLSFAHPGPEATFTFARTHGITEAAIRATGMRHTFLRDNFYLDVFEDFAGQDRVIRGPAGTGRVAAVARTDVIDAAAAVLADPGAHEDRAYTLTGPEALTMTEAARIMSEATGEDYRFQDETLEQARASRAGYGAPEWELEAWISTYTAIAAGELAEVTDDVERLTGHPPLSLEQVMSGRRIA